MSKSASSKKPATAVKKVKGIKVNLFVLGSDGKEVPVKEGTTLGQFRQMNGLEAVNVALNNDKTPKDSTTLSAGDRITVVTQAKGGAQ